MNKVVLTDMTSYAGTIVNHPVEKVWPHVLDQASWMKDFVIESVSGEVNKVGEVKKVLPYMADARDYQIKEVQPFYFKTLTLSPYRKFVYKAYTLHRGGEYGFTGLEILTLKDLIRQTALTLEVYLEWESATMSECELSTFVGKAKEGASALWERNFQRLNAAVDKTVDR